MPKKMTFAPLGRASGNKVTGREKFLAGVKAKVPWSRLPAPVDAHCPRMGRKGGRPATPPEVALRIFCLRQWRLKLPDQDKTAPAASKSGHCGRNEGSNRHSIMP